MPENIPDNRNKLDIITYCFEAVVVGFASMLKFLFSVHTLYKSRWQDRKIWIFIKNSVNLMFRNCRRRITMAMDSIVHPNKVNTTHSIFTMIDPKWIGTNNCHWYLCGSKKNCMFARVFFHFASPLIAPSNSRELTHTMLWPDLESTCSQIRSSGLNF